MHNAFGHTPVIISTTKKEKRPRDDDLSSVSAAADRVAASAEDTFKSQKLLSEMALLRGDIEAIRELLAGYDLDEDTKADLKVKLKYLTRQLAAVVLGRKGTEDGVNETPM